MGQLFGQLYGYWEPSDGWTRTSDPEKERDAFLGGESIEFRHESIGTLTVSRNWGMDDMPIQFTLVLRERPSAFPTDTVAAVKKLFQPVPSVVKAHPVWDHACTVTWAVRPWRMEDGVGPPGPLFQSTLDALSWVLGFQRKPGKRS